MFPLLMNMWHKSTYLLLSGLKKGRKSGNLTLEKCWQNKPICYLYITNWSVLNPARLTQCVPAGRGRVQHREGPSGPNPAAEDHGVLREEREADWAAEEDVSHGRTSQDTSSPFTSHFMNKEAAVFL